MLTHFAIPFKPLLVAQEELLWILRRENSAYFIRYGLYDRRKVLS